MNSFEDSFSAWGDETHRYEKETGTRLTDEVKIAIVMAVMPILFGIDKATGGKRNEKLVYALSGLIALAGVYWLLQRIGVLPG